jgi:hypothetical protein
MLNTVLIIALIVVHVVDVGVDFRKHRVKLAFVLHRNYCLLFIFRVAGTNDVI